MDFCVDARGVVWVVGDAHYGVWLLGEILHPYGTGFVQDDNVFYIFDFVRDGRHACRPYNWLRFTSRGAWRDPYRMTMRLDIVDPVWGLSEGSFRFLLKPSG